MYYVYILTNNINTTFYIGITNNLQRRLYEHQNAIADGFTREYRINKLVFYEEYQNSLDAIKREKQLKNWHREWKLNLVRKKNPTLKDLSDNW